MGLGFRVWGLGSKLLKGGPLGGCQNYGPLLDPDYNTALNIKGTQKGTRILTTTHVYGRGYVK